MRELAIKKLLKISCYLCMTLFLFHFWVCFNCFVDRQDGDDMMKQKTDDCGQKFEFVEEKTVC